MAQSISQIPATLASGQRPLPSRFSLFARDIKLSHSVFALPFAVLGAFLARPREMPRSTFALALSLVVLCMVLARSWAMLINRLADRKLDALNPRTSSRAFASGRLSTRFGAALAGALASSFVLAASLFWLLLDNPWPALLALPVLAWIALYSFTKRFTLACHLFLGGALAASPLAAAIAVNPASLALPSPPHASLAVPAATRAALWCLFGMVTLWVAGFDTIYALQDYDVDRRLRLHSIPASLGISAAIWLSRALHAVAFSLLCLAWYVEPRFGTLFGVGVVCVAILLVGEHLHLARKGRAGLDAAFFTFNGIVSLLVGALGVLDLSFR